MNQEAKGINWRFLIVEDEDDIARQIEEIIPNCVEKPDHTEVEIYGNFTDAKEHLRRKRFDILILDLKEDDDLSPEADSHPAGIAVFEELKQIRFAPVIFFTALAHSVRQFETSFIRVVEKTETVTKVQEEVKRIMATQLPKLTREIEEIQRDYMWDFVSIHWREFDSLHQQKDIAYLLTRRLAMKLENEAKHIAKHIIDQPAEGAESKKIHPMEMYIHPSIEDRRFAGDILAEETPDGKQYWILLTPSCDFPFNKAEFVVLAKCEPLSDQKEYTNWTANKTKGKDSLEKLISDNRMGIRKISENEAYSLQPERFKFLPGTFFIPNLVVDFQQLRSIPCTHLEKFKKIASLDAPFAGAVLARFSRFFGRLGTPDINPEIVISRLNEPQIKPIGQAEPAPATIAEASNQVLPNPAVTDTTTSNLTVFQDLHNGKTPNSASL